MSPTEFFKAVLPSEGRYCVAINRPNDKRVRHTFPTTMGALIDLIETAPEGFNVYFACATYGEERNKHNRITRAHRNVVSLRSLWIDLDVGSEYNDYATQAEALQGLRDFCREVKLPIPLVVNSGSGIHAYWPLDKEYSRAVWQPVADKLKAVAMKVGLKFDVKCTSDSARIMRAPGSFNYNHGEPLPATVMYKGAGPFKLLELTEILSKIETPEQKQGLPFEVPSYLTGEDETSERILGDLPTSNFMTIYHSGRCGQINNLVDNQEGIPEPLWRAGLSIAQACEDREEAIHFMSKNHPKYNAEDTEAKAKSTVGPLSCSKFEEENPQGCEGCSLKGKIKSPIVLGIQAEVEESTEPIEVTALEGGKGEEVKYSIPDYPRPFIRGKDGSVTLAAPEEEGGRQVVYPHPFYIVKRMMDPHEGEVMVTRLHLPHDGVREFSISLRDASATERFRDVVSTQGIALFGTALNQLRTYVLRWAQDLQQQMRAETMKQQFGWTDEGTFILGDREIRPEGVFYSPPARTIANIAEFFGKAGDIEGWKRIANVFDTPGMENRAFVLFAGFGAPLMKFTQLKGGMINLTSPTSGEGKTTLQELINSIWGHPKQLKLEQNDTFNAKMHRMGVMNTLPVTVDEVTNMPALQASEFLYASTTGRGKNRMEGSTNTERLNTTTWCTIVITSANSSLEDKIRGAKMTSEGELMRLMEIPMRRQYVGSKEETDALFGTMEDNYGVVGEVYAQYLVRHQEEVKDLLGQVQRKLDSMAGLSQKERVWSAMAAAALTGGMIAKSLGLHDIDVTRVMKWVRRFLEHYCKTTTEASEVLGASSLGTFLDSHHANTLIINGQTKGRQPTPLFENTRELFVRIEPDTELIFITTSRLRSWCAENQVPFNGLLQELRRLGVQVEFTTKRMSSGTVHTTAPVRTVRLKDPGKIILDTKDLARNPSIKLVGGPDDLSETG